MTLTQDRRAGLLGACPLFRGLDGDGLAAIAGAAIEVEFPGDRVVARQGEIGTNQSDRILHFPLLGRKLRLL